MFKRFRAPSALVAAAFAAVLIVSATAVVASSGERRFVAKLAPVAHDPKADGGSVASGITQINRVGRRTIAVRVRANGLSPFLPHAMHIHGHEAAREIAFCPGADRRDDITDDGLIETAEGLEDYGAVRVSFTKSGDTSPDSTLSLERFVRARFDGTLSYQRRIRVPLKFARRLDELHVVLHGHDINGNEVYDGPNGALGAPVEAELPVACGAINPRP